MVDTERITSDRQSNKKILVRLGSIAIAMFAFSFLLVPIYDVFCEITGLNGKTNNTAYRAIDKTVDTSRLVEVQFLANNNDGMSWEFRPHVLKVEVHPGQPTDALFYAANPTGKSMVAQAIPSITPSSAAQYFHKTECFCFEQQALAAHGAIDMPVRFIVDLDLPKDVKTITLSYTLFDVTDKFGNDKEEKMKRILDKTNKKFKHVEEPRKVQQVPKLSNAALVTMR